MKAQEHLEELGHGILQLQIRLIQVPYVVLIFYSMTGSFHLK